MSSHAALVCLSETSSHLRKMEPDINTLASYKMMRFPTLDLPWGATTKYIVTQSGQLKCFITVEICTLRATREQNHLAVTHKLSRVFFMETMKYDYVS